MTAFERSLLTHSRPEQAPGAKVLRPATQAEWNRMATQGESGETRHVVTAAAGRRGVSLGVEGGASSLLLRVVGNQRL